jgi:hypothetical protein
MFRYLTAYRFFVLAKLGIALAYLWFCWDFFRLNLAMRDHLRELIPSDEVVCDNPTLNSIIVDTLSFLSQPAAIWIFFLLSPVAVILYLWGRYRWLQVGVALWVWVSIVAMAFQISAVMTTADFWLAWCFILYAVAGLVTPPGQWEVSQPGFSKDLWRKNPTIYSEYACLVVVLQFTVYFYAGLNKLIYGWTAWTSGTALQNLSYDPSMHDYVRGIPVPYFISLVLCYVTLFQRLILPFGFFIMRYRGWAVLILGAMHVGYDLLMQVAIFPLMGVSCLLLVIPPRELALPLFSMPSRKQGRPLKLYLKSIPATHPSLAQKILTIAIACLLLIEPAVISYYSSDPPYWNIKLATQLHWIMFADGGVQSKDRFRIGIKIHDPATGLLRYDEITNLPLGYFPDTWRTRLYAKLILLKASQSQQSRQSSGEYVKTDEYLENYINTALKLYSTESPYQPPVEQFLLRIDPYDKKEFSP